MTKYLKAHKVKDGWLTTITKIEHVHTKSEVTKIIRHEGLKVWTKDKDENGETIKIYAD